MKCFDFPARCESITHSGLFDLNFHFSCSDIQYPRGWACSSPQTELVPPAFALPRTTYRRRLQPKTLDNSPPLSQPIRRLGWRISRPSQEVAYPYLRLPVEFQSQQQHWVLPPPSAAAWLIPRHDQDSVLTMQTSVSWRLLVADRHQHTRHLRHQQPQG